MLQKYLQIGEITKPQGLRGEVKLLAMTGNLSQFSQLESVFLEDKGQFREVRVLEGRSYDGFGFLKLDGVSDRNAAEALRGTRVYIDREHAMELGEDENYVCDLVGLEAETTEGVRIGTLRDVLRPNSICDVYVFDTPRGEMMIPALKRVVLSVDLKKGRMILDAAALAEVAVYQDEPAERDD